MVVAVGLWGLWCGLVGGAGIAERAGQGGEGRKGWGRCQLCCPAPPSSRVAAGPRRAAPGVGVALLRGMHARSRAVEGAQQGGDEFAAAFDAAWGAQERYAAAARAMAASNAAASRSGMATSHGEEERSRRLAELRAWSSFEKRKTRVAHSPPRRDAQTPTAERRRRRSSAPPEHARRAHAPATDTLPHAQHRPRPRPASASAVPRATRAPVSGTRASEYVSRSVFDRLYDGPLVVSDSSMCPEKVSQANEWSACALASVQRASERASRALATFLKSTAVDALTRKRRAALRTFLLTLRTGCPAMAHARTRPRGAARALWHEQPERGSDGRLLTVALRASCTPKATRKELRLTTRLTPHHRFSARRHRWRIRKARRTPRRPSMPGRVGSRCTRGERRCCSCPGTAARARERASARSKVRHRRASFTGPSDPGSEAPLRRAARCRDGNSGNRAEAVPRRDAVKPLEVGRHNECVSRGRIGKLLLRDSRSCQRQPSVMLSGRRVMRVRWLSSGVLRGCSGAPRKTSRVENKAKCLLLLSSGGTSQLRARPCPSWRPWPRRRAS